MKNWKKKYEELKEWIKEDWIGVLAVLLLLFLIVCVCIFGSSFFGHISWSFP